jgi:cobalamin biosynthesis protein CobD/CbiB
MTSGASPRRPTIRNWITSRITQAPAALRQQILAALGSDADAPESRTSELCLASAARALDVLLSENRFGRENARELLAIDALTTLAFEYASQTAESQKDLGALAKQSARTLGQLATQRV